MTTEEKARAYDEALEKAKIRYDNNPTDGYVGYANLILEELFPQLHESEGERIGKELIQYLKDYPTNLPNGQYTRADFFAYLEKQKEQKPSTEETELNSIAFLEQLGYTCIPPGAEKKSAELRDSRQIALMIENGRRSGVIEGRKQVVYNPEEYGLCKPAEWSEEDKRMLTRIFELIRYADDHYEFDGKEVSSVNVKAWLLKSLRPQPKQEWNWDDEDFEKFRDVLAKGAFLDEITSIRVAKKLLSFLKHYRSQPHWKPSEEQMRSLEYFIKLWGNSDDQLEYTKVFQNVKSLYNDLKKL